MANDTRVDVVRRMHRWVSTADYMVNAGITHDNTVHVPSNATQGLYLSGWLSRLNSACPSIKICRAFKKFFSFAPMSNRFRMPTASIRYALYVNIIGWWFFLVSKWGWGVAMERANQFWRGKRDMLMGCEKRDIRRTIRQYAQTKSS